MKKKLSSQLFAPGTKFVVTEGSKDTVHGPGTIGFVSCVRGVDSNNPCVIFFDTAINRRGKGGKSRVEMSTIMTPIYKYNGGAYKDLLPPSDTRGYVHIKEILTPEGIKGLSEIDYLAWAYAYASYISRVANQSNIIPMWPHNSNHILNRILNVEETYSSDPEYAKNELARVSARHLFINKVRYLEAKLPLYRLKYHHKTSKLEFDAIDFIRKSGNKSPVIPRAVLKRTERKVKDTIKLLDKKTLLHEKAIVNKGA